jgi:UDP:flavonoid glycosyltransferase YjiC (YdhE family)
VHGLSPVQANTPQVRHIGYKLHQRIVPPVRKLSSARRVLVSVGTIVQPPQSLLTCIAASIALLPVDVGVLWSVRGLDEDVLNQMRRILAAREFKLLPWIHQSKELCDESTSVFVSHAGFNSIAECVNSDYVFYGVFSLY